MLGGFAVGKTSLVARFVSSIFSDKYLTTIGVKIDKKTVALNGEQMDLILWDIYGEDDFQKMRLSYLRGAGGYLLVADGTRRTTLDTARSLHDTVAREIGPVPFVLVLNKSDLADRWEIDEPILADAAGRGWTIIRTSAKTGEGVENAFLTLARGMAG
jgi:small GTP-binding protein